jgi:hypothetical protein
MKGENMVNKIHNIYVLYYLINARTAVHVKGVTDHDIRRIHAKNQCKVCDLK